jgi:uncharacterized protein (DUF1800 family)
MSLDRLWRRVAAACLFASVGCQAYEIGPDISGTFYDPAQSGHGYVVEYIEVGTTPQLVVSWFAYQDGEPVWLVGIGGIDGDTATVPLAISRGADFPPRFVESAAISEPWGTLTLRYSGSDVGSASWTSSLAGYGSGSMPIARLTSLSLAGDLANNRVASCHSGSWFAPGQSGHGLFVEVIGPPQARQMVAVWYTFLQGAQRWITAVGPIEGSTARLEAFLPRGGDFPPNFRPQDVVMQPWGEMRFSGLDGNRARIVWTSSVAGFGSGGLDLQRVTGPAGYDCGAGSDAKAARFLTQATHGPTDASIAAVRSQGLAGWIDTQLALPPTLQRPTIEAQIAQQVQVDPRNAQFYRPYRIERWFNTAVTAPDALRQKVAHALSQVFVVSDIGALDNNPIGVAEFNDILLRGAFGSYRELLREVTYSPAMGVYLTALRNQKTDWTLDGNGALVPGQIAPDENYAREVMQLFSIGLVERRLDYSPILGEDGQPRATYTQDLVTQTAKVMTGLSFDCSGPTTVGGLTLNRNCGLAGGTARYFSPTVFFSVPARYAIPGQVTALAHPDTYRPMACYPRYTDTGRSATASNNYAVLPAPNDRKVLLGGVTIEPSAVACHSGTPAAEQQACIDYCNDQVETLVDTLAAHPNVAPFLSYRLIQRLTTSNPSPGYVKRVASVFENDGSGTRGNLGAVVRAILLDPEARATPAANFGKLREPLLKLTALWRALGALPGSNGAYGVFTPERFLAQRPLGAASVFNFYEVDYALPDGSGLLAPEFQILDESTAITTSDGLWTLVFNGWQVDASNTPRFTTPANSAHIPPAALDALPRDGAGLVEALNQKLLYGSMPDSLRTRLRSLLDGPMASADHRLRALDTLHLILISPAFAVQQ